MAHKKPLYEKVLTHFGGIIIVGDVVKKSLVETKDMEGCRRSKEITVCVCHIRHNETTSAFKSQKMEIQTAFECITVQQMI